MTQPPLQKTPEPFMKFITLMALLVAVGCILATGCVAQPKKDPANATVSPTNTFTPFVNTTTVPATNVSNVTNTSGLNATAGLTGPLRISISGYNAGIPLRVVIDNRTVGNVTREQPLDLIVDEGNHTVQVCVGVICPLEYVEIVFAKRAYLDFGDRLREAAEFPLPTARLINYFKNGNGVGVNVEYINPTEKDLTMSVEISCGYTYIDGRTNLRMGDSVRSKATQWVEAGRRITVTRDLYFAYGSAYTFDEPTLGLVTYE